MLVILDTVKQSSCYFKLVFFLLRLLQVSMHVYIVYTE